MKLLGSSSDHSREAPTVSSLPAAEATTGDAADAAGEALLLAEGGLAHQGGGIEGGGAGCDARRRDGSVPPSDGARGRGRGGHPCADHRDR